jgi:GeoRSP system SPASM domain protein
MELKTPIRIYWDLAPAADAPRDYRAIASEIVASRVLALDLACDREALDGELWQVLEVLQGQWVAVTLTVPASLLSAPVRERLSRTSVKSLLAASSSLTELRALPADFWGAAPPVGIRFSVTDDNYLQIAELFDFCGERGVKRLVLPIQRALPGVAPFQLTPERSRELAARLSHCEIPAKLQLSVHDPFIWKAIYPQLPFPEGGCQAANSMIYIAPDATVYPCPIMPYRLGALGSDTLGEILASEEKKRLRKILVAPPAQCESCPEVAHCLGGCRGRGYLPDRDWDAADRCCGYPVAGVSK